MPIYVVLMIAVSLSMDAFSLSLAYGTLGLNRKDIIKLSIIVGFYHLIMPLLGMLVGTTVFHLLPIPPMVIVFVILLFTGIQMIIESFKGQEVVNLFSLSKMLLFGFAVSVDSFSVGIGLKAINDNYLLCAALFSISSFLFTYLGLYLGKKLNDSFGRIATIFGGCCLILIGIICLII